MLRFPAVSRKALRDRLMVLLPLAAVAAMMATSAALAPHVADLGRRMDDLTVPREMPWHLWKWDPPGGSSHPTSTQCEPEPVQLFSEIIRWPSRVMKDEPFVLGGIVAEESAEGKGVQGVSVAIFLNETKTEPGILLGHTTTDSDGSFILQGRFPDDLPATRYHVVVHALEREEECKKYLEHWSDPEMDVLAKTRLSLGIPKRAVVGEEVRVRGWLRDSGGTPVANETVRLRLGNATLRLDTAEDGTFEGTLEPDAPGELRVSAEFQGTKYHGPSKVAATVPVDAAEVLLDPESVPIRLTRGEPAQIHGQVLGTVPREVQVDFEGIRVSPCDGCKESDRVVAHPAEGGRFTFRVSAPPSEPVGPFRVVVGAPGAQPQTYEGVLLAPVRLSVATEEGAWTRHLGVEVRAVDEAGRPASGKVLLATPGGVRSVVLDAQGRAHIEEKVPCGTHPVTASFPEGGGFTAARQSAQVAVCPWAEGWPPFLVDFPWVLPVLAVALAAGGWWWRRSWLATTPTISKGPPMALALLRPDDAARGIVGLHEEAMLAARLQRPLPRGHRLLMGPVGRLHEAEPDEGHEARFAFRPERTGVLRLRADILGRWGRPRSRRTCSIRVVVYAEEIEKRFLDLQRTLRRTGCALTTPRDVFWEILRRAPRAAEPALRLVEIFEEIDYSPRRARRETLVQYVVAEEEVARLLEAAQAPADAKARFDRTGSGLFGRLPRA